MKNVKLSVLVLSMGLFVASCGNTSPESTEAPATSSEPVPVGDASEAVPAPAADAAPAVDSAKAAAPAETAPAAPAGH